MPEDINNDEGRETRIRRSNWLRFTFSLVRASCRKCLKYPIIFPIITLMVLLPYVATWDMGLIIIFVIFTVVSFIGSVASRIYSGELDNGGLGARDKHIISIQISGLKEVISVHFDGSILTHKRGSFYIFMYVILQDGTTVAVGMLKGM